MREEELARARKVKEEVEKQKEEARKKKARAEVRFCPVSCLSVIQCFVAGSSTKITALGQQTFIFLRGACCFIVLCVRGVTERPGFSCGAEAART